MLHRAPTPRAGRPRSGDSLKRIPGCPPKMRCRELGFGVRRRLRLDQLPSPFPRRPLCPCLSWHTHDQEARNIALGGVAQCLPCVKLHRIAPYAIQCRRHRKDRKCHGALRVRARAPNPALSMAHQRTIALDYGMKSGEVILECRKALLFYSLRRLGLLDEKPEPPEVHQIVLKSRNEMVPSGSDGAKLNAMPPKVPPTQRRISATSPRSSTHGKRLPTGRLLQL